MSINLDVDNDVDKLLEREQLPKRDRKPAGGSKKDAKKGPTREQPIKQQGCKTTKIAEKQLQRLGFRALERTSENICAQNISH